MAQDRTAAEPQPVYHSHPHAHANPADPHLHDWTGHPADYAHPHAHRGGPHPYDHAGHAHDDRPGDDQ